VTAASSAAGRWSGRGQPAGEQQQRERDREHRDQPVKHNAQVGHGERERRGGAVGAVGQAPVDVVGGEAAEQDAVARGG
jgi:hypothetical protein